MAQPNATGLLSGGWQDTFKQITGQHPDELNLKTEAAAENYVKVLQAMRNVQVGTAIPANYNYGSVGTRNEAINPEKQ